MQNGSKTLQLFDWIFSNFIISRTEASPIILRGNIYVLACMNKFRKQLAGFFVLAKISIILPLKGKQQGLFPLVCGTNRRAPPFEESEEFPPGEKQTKIYEKYRGSFSWLSLGQKIFSPNCGGCQ